MTDIIIKNTPNTGFIRIPNAISKQIVISIGSM